MMNASSGGLYSGPRADGQDSTLRYKIGWVVWTCGISLRSGHPSKPVQVAVTNSKAFRQVWCSYAYAPPTYDGINRLLWRASLLNHKVLTSESTNPKAFLLWSIARTLRVRQFTTIFLKIYFAGFNLQRLIHMEESVYCDHTGTCAAGARVPTSNPYLRPSI